MPTASRPRSAPSVAVWIGLAVALVVLGAVGVYLVADRDSDGAPGDDEWVAFEDPTTGLSVDLPGEPSTTEDRIPVGDEQMAIHVHLVDGGEAAWSFTVYSLPSDELDLERAIAAVTDGIDATVVASDDVTVGGFPGIDSEATFTENGRDGVVFSRIVRLDGRQTAVILQSLGLEADRGMLEETFGRLTASFSP